MSARFLQTLASKSRTFKFKIFDITFLLHLATAYRYVDLEFDTRKLISKYHICLHTDLKVGEVNRNFFIFVKKYGYLFVTPLS